MAQLTVQRDGVELQPTSWSDAMRAQQLLLPA
jgi:hypothetical protein